MLIQKLALYGAAVVTVIAAAKTLVILAFFGTELDAMNIRHAGIFAALWLMTAATPLILVTATRHFIEARRAANVQLPPHLQPGIENVIDAHAKAWGLTKAETDVAILLVKGFSNAEIAGIRQSALQTVKTQASAIYQKSCLVGRYQLIAFVTEEVNRLSAQPAQPAPSLGTAPSSTARAIPVTR